MKFRRKTSFIDSCSAIFLMLTLAFLTISLPFVYSAKQFVQQQAISAAADEDKDGDDNPFASTTEEKTSNTSTTFSEEYLHDSHSAEEYLAALCKEYKIEHVATYIAFYGELICPPPDLA